MTSLWQAGNGWRETVLAYFSSPSFHPLSLVADPDGLLLEEQVLAALNARGYDLLTFADSIALRYLYETRYRDQPVPALIVRTGQADVRQLPYDLLQAGRQLNLTLHDICPQLSYPVVRDFFRAAPDRTALAPCPVSARLRTAQPRRSTGPRATGQARQA